MSKVIEIEEIKSRLMHRYPFLLVDRVLDYTAGESIHAIKNVTVNEPFFTGHFPKKSVMPGVLMIESMAQTAGLLWFFGAPEGVGRLPFLAGVDNVRFRRLVVPGDQMHIHLKVIKFRAGMARFNSIIQVDSQDVCQADLLIALEK